MDLEFSNAAIPPVIPLFEDVGLSVCLETSDDSLPIHNLGKVRELLLLRRSEIFKARGLQNAQEETMIDSQITSLIEYYAVDNQIKLIWASRLRVLQAWTQLALLMIQGRSSSQPNSNPI